MYLYFLYSGFFTISKIFAIRLAQDWFEENHYILFKKSIVQLGKKRRFIGGIASRVQEV